MTNETEMETWVAVGAVVRNPDGEVLLVKHVSEKDGFWSDEWICPGGGLEDGEKLEDGARREVREETSLEIEIQNQIPAFSRVLDDEERHVVYVDFKAKKAETSPDATPGSDVGTVEWFSPDEIDELEDLHDDTRRLLDLAEIL
ncbi:NUDIX hydrolase [Halorutilales archaeon Cl-col2-1]